MRSTPFKIAIGFSNCTKSYDREWTNAGRNRCGRNAATIQANSLNSQIRAPNKQIAAAERLSGQESVINDDLQALNQIAEYAKGLVGVSTVLVRFHVGDRTIPATEK